MTLPSISVGVPENELKAGRALDAEIAEKVMGFSGVVRLRQRGRDSYAEFFTKAPKFASGIYGAYYAEDGTKFYCGRPSLIYRAPNYSTDIAAAWEVMDVARKWSEGFNPLVTFPDNQSDAGKRWLCFVRALPPFFHHLSAAEAAETICLAALKAVA